MFTTETVYIRKCWVLKIMIDYFEKLVELVLFPLTFCGAPSGSDEQIQSNCC